MNAIRLVLCALMLCVTARILHAQADMPDYVLWQSTWLSSPSDPHFYLSANLLSTVPGTANVRIGIGGVFPEYEVTVQACMRMPDGSLNPLAPPTTVSNPHNGNYSEIVLGVQTVPMADVFHATLTPINYPEPGAGGAAGVVASLANLNTVSNIAVATRDTTCPVGCYKATGKCGECGSPAPKCCKTSKVVIDCGLCVIACLEGNC